MEQFVVSARKYRPATFASVVGQKHITSTLKNAIERNQLAHAYLFCGPRGVGKTTCARIFAKAINCLNPSGAEACNECDSCRSFNEGRSLNIHELDAASNNSVEDIRNLIEQTRVIPQIGHYSVFIIDEVHMLSQAAFNAFLKTLEEPPQHAVFILATTEKHKIIPTILSRCQIYDFNRIRVEDAVEYLKYIASQEGVTADEESLNLIAQKADGGMRDALSMFDKAVSFCGTSLEYRTVAQTLNVLDYDTYFRFTDLLREGDYINALLDFDRVLSKGFSGQIFMHGLNQHLRDLLVAKGPAISLIEYTGALMERYRRQAEVCDTAFLFGAISLLSEADGRLRTASNQRLLVELTLMKIAALAQKKNSGLNLPDEEHYPLPDLTSTPKQVVAQQVASAPQPVSAAPSGASSVVSSAAPSGVSNAAPSATPNVAPSAPTTPPAQPSVAPQPSIQPSIQPTAQQPVQPSVQPVAQPTVQPSAPQPAQPAMPRTRRSGLVPGGSLTSLLNRMSGGADGEGDAVHHEDPESEQKLTAKRDEIVEMLGREYPMLKSVVEGLRFEGNKMVLEVPTDSLREELRHTRSEILESVSLVAEINGVLDLEVILKEVEVKLRPVKLEDRLRHIESKSGEVFHTLCKALDLDVE